MAPPPLSMEARVARRNNAKSSSSSGIEISTCFGGKIRGAKRKRRGNDNKSAKDRTKGVLNIATLYVKHI